MKPLWNRYFLLDTLARNVTIRINEGGRIITVSVAFVRNLYINGGKYNEYRKTTIYKLFSCYYA